ncbi:MAG: hypothetical protein E7074_07030 [Bacteroidales bacterium]|jgi:hypothetical protein|nr:hypothetical protein [Bacteroidales bacterium]
MKKVISILIVTLGLISCSSSKSQEEENAANRVDSMLQVNNAWLEHIELDMSLKNRFKMYKTESLYNLLKLDTKTGKVWQVQWYLDDPNREGTWVINDSDLSMGEGYGSNSFELYPTNNIYQFILIDKTDGRMWHLQWGTGGNKERWIRRIYEW